MRAIALWRVAPHQAIADDVDDPADDAAVVNARHAARLVRQERLKAGELIVRKPEVVRGHRKLPTGGSLNHISGPLGTLFMGP